MKRPLGMLMTHLVACNTCGKEIAKSASTCPHCGARQGMGGFLRFVIWLFGILALLILYAVFFSGPRLPTCDSSTAASEVARAMEDAPMGRVLGLKLIKITDAREVSANDKQRRCRGTAHLSNAQSYPITYKFYVDAQDDVMVEAQVRGL
jgi:hypothetical protein